MKETFPVPKMFTVMIKFDLSPPSSSPGRGRHGKGVDRADVNGADTDGWSANDAFPGGGEARAWLAPRARIEASASKRQRPQRP